MATVKIDTEIDTGGLDDLVRVFEKFAGMSQGTRATWQGMSDDIKTISWEISEAVDEIKGMNDRLDKSLKSTRDLDTTTEKVSRRWTSLARGTKEAAGHIKDATGSLLKWAGITGLVAGVAGFGAEHMIFGLGRSVSANRSTAMGLGTTYGGLAAARVGYQRFGDAEGLLGRIADAQNDGQKQLPFGALGMGRSDYQGRDSADVMADVMRRAKDVLDKVPDDQLGNRARTSHLDEFFSLEEMRRIKNASREEVEGAAGGIARNRRELDLDPKVQRQWTDFTTKMSLAGATIETVFVNRLVALEPGLLKLSEAATKIATTLLAKDGPIKGWLDEINHGMEWLAAHIDDKKFQDEVGGFMSQIVGLGAAAWNLAKSAGSLLHWFAKLTGTEETKPSDDATAAASGPSLTESLKEQSGTHQGGRRGFGGLSRPLPSLDSGGGGMTGLRAHRDGSSGSRGAWWTDERMKHAYDRLVAGGLTPLEAQGQIARMAYVEAGSGPTAHNNIGGGHLGIYQASRDRQRHFGGSTDFDAQLDAIAAEKKGPEAYSHRIGQAAKDDYGAALAASTFERGEGYDPRSGRDLFTGKTMAAIPEVRRIVAPPPTTVTVNKNPGGNPTQTAAMAAAPQ